MKRFYHATAYCNVASILAHGLKPRGGKGADDYVANDPMWNMSHDGAYTYLSSAKWLAEAFAQYPGVENHCDGALLLVTLTDAQLKHLSIDERLSPDSAEKRLAWKYDGVIPAKQIKLLQRLTVSQSESVNRKHREWIEPAGVTA